MGERKFMKELVDVHLPFAQAFDILQGEKDVSAGYHTHPAHADVHVQGGESLFLQATDPSPKGWVR